MKIKKEFIGSKCWSSLLSRWFVIEESKGDLYYNLGIFDIYEIEKPKLIKKENVINTKKRNNAINSDGDGIDNDPESGVFI
jgi:hypothetical protein